MLKRSLTVVVVMLTFITMSVFSAVHADPHDHEHADHSRGCPVCLALTSSDDSQALADPVICDFMLTTQCMPVHYAITYQSKAVILESIRAPPCFIS